MELCIFYVPFSTQEINPAGNVQLAEMSFLHWSLFSFNQAFLAQYSAIASHGIARRTFTNQLKSALSIFKNYTFASRLFMVSAFRHRIARRLVNQRSREIQKFDTWTTFLTRLTRFNVMQPKVYISYSRGESSSVTAMFYVEAHIDLYGWYMTAREQRLSTAFFMVENFYADRTPVLYRSIEDDVYVPWTTDFPPTRNAIRCPIPDAITHELERIQSNFVQEWLFFESDPDVASELDAYRMRGLPVQAANIRCKKLNRLDKDDENWIHTTPGTDFNVAEFLEKYWRFDEKT